MVTKSLMWILFFGLWLMAAPVQAETPPDWCNPALGCPIIGGDESAADVVAERSQAQARRDASAARRAARQAQGNPAKEQD